MSKTITINAIQIASKVDEEISLLKEKGIRFELCNESEAKLCLEKHKNYSFITAYESNFEKNTTGLDAGKYTNLDFAYLKDMYVIDSMVKSLLFEMIIEIEHGLEALILKEIEQIGDGDGINVVNGFMDEDYYDQNQIHNTQNENDKKYKMQIHQSIQRMKDDENVREILDKYNVDINQKIQNIPAKDLLQILSFGEKIKFFDYITSKYQLDDRKYLYFLKEVKQLRNEIAHGKNILSTLRKRKSCNLNDTMIIDYLSNCGIGRENRNNKLSNPTIRRITFVLYLFDIFVENEYIKHEIKKAVNELFFGRVILCRNYYIHNGLLKSTYCYFEKIIKKYFKEFEG